MGQLAEAGQHRQHELVEDRILDGELAREPVLARVVESKPRLQAHDAARSARKGFRRQSELAARRHILCVIDRDEVAALHLLAGRGVDR